MTATQALDRFERHARPWLNYLPLNSCIEQARILIECLKPFDIPARAVGAKLHVRCDAKGCLFVAGIDQRDYDRGHAIVPNWIERSPFTGALHVMTLVEERILVELTLAQVSAPEFGLDIERCMLKIPSKDPFVISQTNHPRVEAELILDDGTPINAIWDLIPGEDWTDTPAWEPSHLWPMIHRIIHDMRSHD
jgi:hypothetical protein